MNKNEEVFIVEPVDPDIFVTVARAYLEAASLHLNGPEGGMTLMEDAMSLGLRRAREELERLSKKEKEDNYLYRVLNLGELLDSKYRGIGLMDDIVEDSALLSESLLKAAAVTHMEVTSSGAKFDSDDLLRCLLAFERERPKGN